MPPQKWYLWFCLVAVCDDYLNLSLKGRKISYLKPTGILNVKQDTD